VRSSPCILQGSAFAALFTFIGAASETAFSEFVVEDSASLADVMIYLALGP